MNLKSKYGWTFLTLSVVVLFSWKVMSFTSMDKTIGVTPRNTPKDNMVDSSATTDLKGFNDFVRTNPYSDKFDARHFHHVEFYCGDAWNTCNRFRNGLGMNLIAKSDLSTGNSDHASYCLESGDVKMLFTAPLGGSSSTNDDTCSVSPFPTYNKDEAYEFFRQHGTAVKAVGIEVDNVTGAYEAILKNGGISVQSPKILQDANNLGTADFAEVKLYGNVVLRLLNLDNFTGKCLPNFQKYDMTEEEEQETFGIQKIDHIVGNLETLKPHMDNIMNMTGFHTFAEFVAEDVGTVDSGLNSVVLASNNEKILLPLNEPTFGTPKKSQIQTYLEQNNGAGVQHIALFTDDIFRTMERMRNMTNNGGFEFMATQPSSYYDNLTKRIGEDAITPYQLEQSRKLGLLVDRDDQGVLLQIFTKPVGDRPTIFLEIIQRVGCDDENGEQKPGCGGFGKGNFKDLFQSIEDYESTLKV